jgi:hypothetical protein
MVIPLSCSGKFVVVPSSCSSKFITYHMCRSRPLLSSKHGCRSRLPPPPGPQICRCQVASLIVLLLVVVRMLSSFFLCRGRRSVVDLEPGEVQRMTVVNVINTDIFLMRDAPALHLRLTCNARCDFEDARHAHLLFSSGRVSA